MTQRKPRIPKVHPIIPALFVCASLSGCAHVLAPEALPADASPVSEVDSLRSDMKTAQESQVDVMAPESFSKADGYFEKAKDELSSGKESRRVLENIGYARAYLKQAENQAALVETDMPEVVRARGLAVRAGAGYFEEEMGSADSRLKNMAGDQLANRQPDIHDLSSLETRYLDLELKAIKQRKLASVREKLEKAKREDAKKYAPSSYALAEKRLDAAEKTIETDRHDDAAIDRAVSTADRAAEHCMQLAESAKNSSDKSPEQIAMDMESKDNAWVRSEMSAETAKAEVGEKDRVIAQQSEELKTAQEDSSEAAPAVALSQDAENARKMFTDQEAEVYLEGGNVVIRLKSMHFAPGSHDIPEESIDTLEKVKQFIRDVDPAKVVIEGHTDDRGSSRSNLTLSEKRAAAVSQFFADSEGLRQKAFEHLGYGDQKPIASNRTGQGRAENRRVDIIVEP